MLLLWFALSSTGACEAKKRDNAQNSNQSTNAANANSQPEAGTVKDDLRILSRGQLSSISNAFIFVARDAETYGALQKVVTRLPQLEQNFFESNAVVAAFLGERRTGGYGVEFKRATTDGLRVDETKPPKDSMTTQSLTYPFAIVAVPMSSNQTALRIDAGGAWKLMRRNYVVNDGEFTMSGGITGRSEKFGITGSLGLMREGSLVTLLLELQSKSGAERRVLVDAASGTVRSDGTISINKLGTGSFVDLPADALSANIVPSDNERKLSVTFASVPGIVRDGFNGAGSLTATAQGPAPQKRSASTKDAPQ